MDPLDLFLADDAPAGKATVKVAAPEAEDDVLAAIEELRSGDPRTAKEAFKLLLDLVKSPEKAG